MSRIGEFFEDHLRAVLIVLIAVVGAVIIAIAVSLIIGGDNDRSLVISEISGNVFIMKNDGQIPAVRNMAISSGDLVVTSEGSAVKLRIDNGKFIYIEPESTVYVYYTKKTNKGSIIVNISDGSVLCRLDKPLTKNEVFEVRTPNSVNSVQGTVFHVDFNYYEELGAYTKAMLTDVRCIEGTVALQLYDSSGNKVKAPEQLMQGNAAEMLSASGTSAYNYLNQPFLLTELSENILQDLIKASAERDLPYTLADLNDAYVTVKSRNESGVSVPTPIVTAPVTDNDIFTSIPEGDGSDMWSTSETTTTVRTEAYEEETEEDTEEYTAHVTAPGFDEDITEPSENTEILQETQDTTAAPAVTAAPDSESTTTVTAAEVSETSQVSDTSLPPVTSASFVTPPPQTLPSVTTSATQPSLHIYTHATAAETAVTASAVPSEAVTSPETETAPPETATSVQTAETAASPHTVFTVPANTEPETVYTEAPASKPSRPKTETSRTEQTEDTRNWWEIVNSENE